MEDVIVACRWTPRAGGQSPERQIESLECALAGLYDVHTALALITLAAAANELLKMGPITIPGLDYFFQDCLGCALNECLLIWP